MHIVMVRTSKEWHLDLRFSADYNLDYNQYNPEHSHYSWEAWQWKGCRLTRLRQEILMKGYQHSPEKRKSERLTKYVRVTKCWPDLYVIGQTTIENVLCKLSPWFPGRWSVTCTSSWITSGQLTLSAPKILEKYHHRSWAIWGQQATCAMYPWILPHCKSAQNEPNISTSPREDSHNPPSPIFGPNSTSDEETTQSCHSMGTLFVSPDDTLLSGTLVNIHCHFPC